MNVSLGLIDPSKGAGVSAEFEESRKRKTRESERALMLAVLEDAIACYQKHLLAGDHTGKTLFREAEEWIWEKDGDRVFSFENICEVLGLDPDYLRQGLLRLKARIFKARSGGKIYPLTQGGTSRNPSPAAQEEIQLKATAQHAGPRRPIAVDRKGLPLRIMNCPS